MQSKQMTLPKAIKKGDTVGICTPSFPAHSVFPERFSHAINELERVGFKVKLGELTAKTYHNKTHQGYRSGTPQQRAHEFMGLIADDEVDFIMSTIGGSNSSSMIPYLDFELIRQKRKIFVGYSDVTALHMAILTQSKLSTLYGAAVVPTFGEYPEVLPESLDSFFAMVSHDSDIEYQLPHFTKWSNHKRAWSTDEWKILQREYQDNPLPTILNKGKGVVESNIIAANLNTLYSLAGTPYFPKLDGEILLIEQMGVEFSQEERIWTAMKLMGVFDNISGLIIGKPEFLNTQGAPFSYDELIMECIGDEVQRHDYPVISEFDCSHTHPMHSIPQMASVRLNVIADVMKGESILTILKQTVAN